MSLDNCTLISGNGGSSAQVINVTGIGGQGSGGSHHGVNIGSTLTNTVAVNLNSTSLSNAINFFDCIGGNGVTNGNSGVSITENLIVTENWLRISILRGASGANINGGGVIAGLLFKTLVLVRSLYLRIILPQQM